METTKSQIINYLFRNKSATIKEISEALHLTKANIRHHMHALLQDGDVIESNQYFLAGKGRPAKLYTLSPKNKPNNYKQICWLLQEIFDSTDNSFYKEDDFIETLITNIPGLPSLSEEGTNIITRLNHAITILNELNYFAHWEASKEGPLVIFDHCPYQEIVSTKVDSFYCKMDRALLKRLTTLEAIPLKTHSINNKNAYQCVFVLKEKT